MFWFVRNYGDFNTMEVYDDTDNTFVKVNLHNDIDLLKDLAYNNKFGGEFYIGYNKYYYIIPKFVFVNPNKLDEYKKSNMKSILSVVSETYFPIDKLTKEDGVWSGYNYINRFDEIYVDVVNIQSGRIFRFNFSLSGKTIFISHPEYKVRHSVGIAYIEDLDKEYNHVSLNANLLYLEGKWRYVVRTPHHYVYIDALNIFDKSNIIVVKADNYVKQRELPLSVRRVVPKDYRLMRKRGETVDLTMINYNSLNKNFGDFEIRKANICRVSDKVKEETSADDIEVVVSKDLVVDEVYAKEEVSSDDIEVVVSESLVIDEISGRSIDENPKTKYSIKSILFNLVFLLMVVFIAPFILVFSLVDKSKQTLDGYMYALSVWNSTLIVKFITVGCTAVLLCQIYNYIKCKFE